MAENQGDGSEHRNGFSDFLGIETVDRRRGFARLRLPVRDELLNGHGTVHGGVLASLVDNAIGAAIATLEADRIVGLATTDLNISYLNAAKGEAITAEATILESGNTISFGEAELLDDAGDLVAKGRATFRLFT